ncbi:MAG: MBL fold metallo-hydrolase [Candidatus Eremiobacteraeota bacterium]|nr:MBL fold metallo-hydrolase [Candidatus Eremiobacteraeota bacterium]
MSLFFKQFKRPGLAQLAYLVGDRSKGIAALIDPCRDVLDYLETARKAGLRITHAIETHIHADFVSGTREVRRAVGAAIVGGQSADYSFELDQYTEGDTIDLGRVRLQAMHTPGHTPEHLSWLLFDSGQGDEPIAVFTGDTLFNLDVGRPDLVGDDGGADNARALYGSLFDKLLPLGDRIEVYPGHGAGSACGKSIGGRDQSTLGNERRFSEALKERSQKEFVEWLTGEMPEPPTHYRRLKKVNASGAALAGPCPSAPQPLTPQEFQTLARQEGTLILDTRSMLAFGGGHIPNALNIPLLPQFVSWAGWMLDPQVKLLLVVENERDLVPVREHLFRIGLDNLAGYLHGGMSSWQEQARPLDSVEQWTVHELDRRRQQNIAILDVRSPQEWNNGNIPGAIHQFVPHLEANLAALDRDRPVAVYCGTGYRASIGASILKRNGFDRVANIPGSWKAWRAADLPVQQRGRELAAKN